MARQETPEPPIPEQAPGPAYQPGLEPKVSHNYPPLAPLPQSRRPIRRDIANRRPETPAPAAGRST